MKKITLLLAGMMASGMVSAVTFDQTDSLKMTDCPNLLNENVQINLSNGVVAGVSCNATGIAIGGCHTAGRTTAREVEVLVASPDPNAAPGTLVSQNPKVYRTAKGPAVATGSTFQGTVVSLYPEAASCTSTVAESTAAERLED
ncbi:hypothetical protein [Stutzerimonas nitrititolerans]|uniref:hypothetical protein n=1 Tax=Stutzerimonas nitrititolerans TaxID=2482751 RepID=UPI0028AE61EA|nr:hypothetical protein [Stutzerimonas nitrititolerans]